MRVLTLKSLKGCMLPGGKTKAGTDYTGINMAGTTTETEAIYAKGWTLAIRGPFLAFLSPLNHAGKRMGFLRPLQDFDVGLELDDGESIESLQRWDSHPAQSKEKK